MRIRQLTGIGAWALTDHVLSSATNFLASIVVARNVGPAGFGSFMLAFGTWTLLLGATRSMLVQPYTVAVSEMSPDDWRVATGSTAATVLLFGTVFSIVAICAGLVLGVATATGSCFIALGIFATPLALQDFWRFAAFSRRAPRSAALNDATWAIAQMAVLGVLAITNQLTPAMAMASWGAGALAGSVFGIYQSGVHPSLGLAGRTFLRKHAPLAGWFGVSNAAFQAGSYGSLVLIGGGIGPSALGGLSSAENLIAPARLVASSGEAVVLPLLSASAKRDDREYFRKLCVWYSCAAMTFFLVVTLALVVVGPFALSMLFGDEFRRYEAILPAIGAAASLSALASGLVMGLRALGKGRELATAQLSSSVVRLVIVWLSLGYGLTGVAWGLVAAEAARTSLVAAGFARALRQNWQGGAAAPTPIAPTNFGGEGL